LLAARALSGHFARVIVLDKDSLPGPERTRKAVPQGNHIHVIWSGGAAAIERMLPGLWDELQARGAIAFDNCSDMRWFQRGVWKLRAPTGFVMYSQSRPCRTPICAPCRQCRGPRHAVQEFWTASTRCGAHYHDGSGCRVGWLVVDASAAGQTTQANGYERPRIDGRHRPRTRVACMRF
jgi:hypothetical protein